MLIRHEEPLAKYPKEWETKMSSTREVLDKLDSQMKCFRDVTSTLSQVGVHN